MWELVSVKYLIHIFFTLPLGLMCGFHFYLYSQILNHFVLHSISTSFLLRFCFYLIAEFGLELYNIFSPGSEVRIQHLVPFVVWLASSLVLFQVYESSFYHLMQSIIKPLNTAGSQ